MIIRQDLDNWYSRRMMYCCFAFCSIIIRCLTSRGLIFSLRVNLRCFLKHCYTKAMILWYFCDLFPVISQTYSSATLLEGQTEVVLPHITSLHFSIFCFPPVFPRTSVKELKAHSSMYECHLHDTRLCYAYSKINRTRTKYFTKHQKWCYQDYYFLDFACCSVVAFRRNFRVSKARSMSLPALRLPSATMVAGLLLFGFSRSPRVFRAHMG